MPKLVGQKRKRTTYTKRPVKYRKTSKGRKMVLSKPGQGAGGAAYRGAGTVTVSRQILPKRVFANLRYVCPLGQHFIIGSNSYIPNGSTNFHWEYRLDSIYDPDAATNWAGQPSGYSQYQALYKRYHVHAAKVKLAVQRVYGSGTAQSYDNGMWMALVAPPAGTVMNLDYNTILEGNPTYVSRRWLPPVSSQLPCAPQNAPAVLKKYINLKKLNQSYDPSVDTAEFGQNPNRNTQISCVFWTGDGIASDNNGNYEVSGYVQIDYYVELYNPINVYTN